MIHSILQSIVKTASIATLGNIHDIPILDFITKISAEYNSLLNVRVYSYFPHCNWLLCNSQACIIWSLCLNQTKIGSFGLASFIFGCIFSILIICCCCQKMCPCFSQPQNPCCITSNFHSYRLTEQNLCNRDEFFDKNFRQKP